MYYNLCVSKMNDEQNTLKIPYTFRLNEELQQKIKGLIQRYPNRFPSEAAVIRSAINITWRIFVDGYGRKTKKDHFEG